VIFPVYVFQIITSCLLCLHQGELLLLDGRIAGHRKFKRFYKQRYSDLDTSVETVTINGVERPKPSKMMATVRRYPKVKQEQMLLGYTEGGVDAVALVPQSRAHSGLVSVSILFPVLAASFSFFCCLI
jgi:hypothetical protein